MFKSFGTSEDAPMVNCPAGLSKATALAAPPGLSLPENPGSPPLYQIQPDEQTSDIKSPPTPLKDPKTNSMSKDTSNQLLRRMKSLSIQELKDGNGASWLTLAEALARSNDPENAATLLKTVIQE